MNTVVVPFSEMSSGERPSFTQFNRYISHLRAGNACMWQVRDKLEKLSVYIFSHTEKIRPSPFFCHEMTGLYSRKLDQACQYITDMNPPPNKYSIVPTNGRNIST